MQANTSKGEVLRMQANNSKREVLRLQAPHDLVWEEVLPRFPSAKSEPKVIFDSGLGFRFRYGVWGSALPSCQLGASVYGVWFRFQGFGLGLRFRLRVEGVGFRGGVECFQAAESEPTLMMYGSGFGVQGSGFMVQGAASRVQCSGFRVQGLGFMVQCAGSSVEGSEFRVLGLGLRVESLGFGVSWMPNRSPRLRV